VYKGKKVHGNTQQAKKSSSAVYSKESKLQFDVEQAYQAETDRHSTAILQIFITETETIKEI
jgi:hypothetical protein